MPHRGAEDDEIRDAYPHAERLGLNYEPVTVDRSAPERLGASHLSTPKAAPVSAA